MEGKLRLILATHPLVGQEPPALQIEMGTQSAGVSQASVQILILSPDAKLNAMLILIVGWVSYVDQTDVLRSLTLVNLTPVVQELDVQ